MSLHRTASTAGWISIIVNTFLFGFKYWAGVVTGSVAIIVDAWHTLSDSLSSVIVLLGIKISRKPADANHPFGHGRADLIASLIIGVILGVVAVNFLIESIERLAQKESVHYGTVALIAIITSIVMKELMAQYAFWAGKKTKAPSLIADAWHHRSDSVASALILVGILVSRFAWWIDAALGVAVSVLILFAAYGIIRKGINPLLGERPDKKLLDHVNRIAERLTGARLDIHHVHIHNYGNHKELTFHIRVEGDSLIRGHRLATEMEGAIREELAMEATIHIEPLEAH